jgi:hypothetical protein
MKCSEMKNGAKFLPRLVLSCAVRSYENTPGRCHSPVL